MCRASLVCTEHPILHILMQPTGTTVVIVHGACFMVHGYATSLKLDPGRPGGPLDS